MTLSDRTVRQLLQREFHCTWGNTDGDAAAGESFAHEPGDPAGSCIRGNGEHNVQLLILTPEGEILGALAGFLSAEELAEELRFASALWRDLQRAVADEQLDREDVEGFVADAHERRVRELEKREWKGPLADFAKRRALSDHRFSARRALMPYEEFRIVDMVGSARTFFGTSQGGRPGGRIGR